MTFVLANKGWSLGGGAAGSPLENASRSFSKGPPKWGCDDVRSELGTSVYTKFVTMLRAVTLISSRQVLKFDRATVVGLGQIELRTSKMRTSRWTVIISKQLICTANFNFLKLHVEKCPSRSSHLGSSKFDWAKSCHSGSTREFPDYNECY